LAEADVPLRFRRLHHSNKLTLMPRQSSFNEGILKAGAGEALFAVHIEHVLFGKKVQLAVARGFCDRIIALNPLYCYALLTARGVCPSPARSATRTATVGPRIADPTIHDRDVMWRR
jgi:hypothetical protein